jgi:hypothetical protein
MLAEKFESPYLEQGFWRRRKKNVNSAEKCIYASNKAKYKEYIKLKF